MLSKTTGISFPFLSRAAPDRTMAYALLLYKEFTFCSRVLFLAVQTGQALPKDDQ